MNMSMELQLHGWSSIVENIKVRVNSAEESKEVQELFFELGYRWIDIGAVYYKTSPSFNYITAYCNGKTLAQGYGLDAEKEITIPQLRDLVVLKRNDVNDATHENCMFPYIKLSDGWYYFDDDTNKWLKSIGGKPEYFEKLKPIEKKMTETEYLMQGKNGERLMDSVGQLKSSQWDIQVGGGHYKNMKIQPAKFALENKLDYCQANAIKYICRHESKNGKQDLEKAKHYIDLLIEHYYG